MQVQFVFSHHTEKNDARKRKLPTEKKDLLLHNNNSNSNNNNNNFSSRLEESGSERQERKRNGEMLHISTDAKKLLAHERNGNVKWSPNDACFVVKSPKGRSVNRAGLAVMLKRTFWPDFNFQRVVELMDTEKGATKSLSQKRRRDSKETRSAIGLKWEDIPRQTVTGRSHKRRLERGKTVHDELCCYARGDIANFLNKYPKPEIYTLRIIKALRELGLEAIYGELPIYDEVVGYATAIDMICVDQNAPQKRDLGRLVLCEIKTGNQEETFDKGHKPMKGPAHFLQNSSLNQALLQAYFTELTLRWRYDITDCMSVVLLVHDKGVKGYVVPNEISKVGPLLYEYAMQQEKERLQELKARSKARGYRRRRRSATRGGTRKK